jgi:hypothetical protein
MPRGIRLSSLASFCALGVVLAATISACSSSLPNTGDGPGTGSQTPGADVCHDGVAGCACSTPGAVAKCGELVRRDGDYTTCSMGTASCVDGRWSNCVGDRVVVQSNRSATGGAGGVQLLAATNGCNRSCDPACQEVAADPTRDVDAAGILTGDGGVTLPGSIGGGSGSGCQGLKCQVALCGGNPNATTITGVVTDPAGNVPLYNAFVYVPLNPDLTQLPVIPDARTNNVSCDTCSGATLSAAAVANTGADGSFTLRGVPAGTNIPLVVQMGKWRRVIVISTVTQCVNNTVANNCTATDRSLCATRLPKNRFDGYNPANGSYTGTGKADIPRIAMVTGDADPFECMLLKAGIDPNEFGSTTKNADRRIHFYESADAPGTSIDSSYGDPVTGDVLWNSLTNLKKYDGVILACEGSAIDKSSTGKTPYKNLIDYTSAGGRVFASHYSYVWLQYPKTIAGLNDWQNVASWTHTTGTSNTQDPLPATIVTSGFPKGQAFSQWLTNVGAASGPGTIDLHEGRQDLTTVGTNTQSWMTATNSRVTSGGAFNPHFTFNTPYGAAAASQCGRVLFSDFHVSASALINADDTTCLADNDCGYSATCQGTVLSTGTCSEPCRVNSDCSSGYTCVGATAGTCVAATCNSSNPCDRGTCTSGKCKCSRDSHCGSSNCQSSGCTSSSCIGDSDCGRSEVCAPGSLGQCQKTCTSSTTCTNGETCNGGTCSQCNFSDQCKTRNYPATCVGGGTRGTCMIGSVANNRDWIFPGACKQGPLSPQEKALEFMFFDLTACITPDNTVPTAPSTLFTAATFTQDYTASCGTGTHPVWREVNWQATLPTGTSVDFSAQSGESFTTLKPTSPLSVVHATTSTTLPAYDIAYVDTGAGGNGVFNRASPTVASGNVLRLTVTLNPTSDQLQAPTLNSWKMVYACVPSE